MTTMPAPGLSPAWRWVRWAIWGGAAGLLLLPAIAMRFTPEVDWSAGDFVAMGIMLGTVCALFELGLRRARSNAYVFGALCGAGTGFLIVWSNLAVGIVGNEDNPVNLIFFLVVLLAMTLAALSRLQPGRLARAMYATAAVQALTALLPLLVGEWRVVVILGVFAFGWLLAGLLFDQAARDTAAAG
jgi:hypothetical protein